MDDRTEGRGACVACGQDVEAGAPNDARISASICCAVPCSSQLTTRLHTTPHLQATAVCSASRCAVNAANRDSSPLR